MKLRPPGLHLVRRNRRALLMIVPLLLLIGILAIVLRPRAETIAAATVARGDFVIDVEARGEIEAVNAANVTIPRARVRMALQIVKIVAEGTQVAAGDSVLQLDPSEAHQRVEQAANALAGARAQLDSERATTASAMAGLRSQLESERYSHEQAQLALRMMEYEAETRRREAELSLRKADLALAQAEARIAAQEIIDRARLRKAELEVAQAEGALKEVRDALAALTLTAPTDGLVVYKETWSGSGMKKIQVGDNVWPGMAVLAIPDLSSMKADVTIQEADISRIALDQPAVVTVEALGAQTYTASVVRIAPLARRETATNMKVFDVEVAIEGSDPRLRPGMTCRCRIETARFPDVIHIPLQAVFDQEGTAVAYVMEGRGPRPRALELGERSREAVIVRAGLEVGERICLRDPTRPLEQIGGGEENAGVSLGSGEGS